MTSPAALTASPASMHSLLEQVLTGDSRVRHHASMALVCAGLGELKVIDYACLDGHGRPLSMPVKDLRAHLDRLEDPSHLPLHTPANTDFGDPEAENAYGPGRR